MRIQVYSVLTNVIFFTIHVYVHDRNLFNLGDERQLFAKNLDEPQFCDEEVVGMITNI